MTHGTGGFTEADIIRWVGIAVGVIGTVVAASSGAAWISSRFVHHLRAWGRWLRSQLARWLPFLRISATVVPLSAAVTASSGLSSVATGRIWDPNASTEIKVEVLHEQIDKMEQRIGEIRQEMSERHAHLDQRVDALTGELRKETLALRLRLESEEEEAARVDARGLPLIGVGIILSGVPDGLARVAVVGWLVVGGSGVLALAVVRSSLRRRRTRP